MNEIKAEDVKQSKFRIGATETEYKTRQVKNT